MPPEPCEDFPMSDTRYSSDVAFTPAVKAVQARKGSRGAYARVEERGSWQTIITPDLAAFVEAQISVFLATANRDGNRDSNRDSNRQESNRDGNLHRDGYKRGWKCHRHRCCHG